MIHSARPTISPVVNIVFTWNLFCFARFWKVGTDIHTDGRTDNMCENNDPYRPRLWCGRVDQKEALLPASVLLFYDTSSVFLTILTRLKLQIFLLKTIVVTKWSLTRSILLFLSNPFRAKFQHPFFKTEVLLLGINLVNWQENIAGRLKD